MKKFENCDVLAVLYEIMRHNTRHFQSDFDVDKEIIRSAAESYRPDRKNLLWMSRPNGTHCFHEQDVYVAGTGAHNSWKFYGEETSDNIVAYAIELDWLKESGPVTGTLYELDYDAHYKHVKKNALPAHMIRLVMDGGKELDVKYSPNFWYKGDNIREVIYFPGDIWTWRKILEKDRSARRDDLSMTDWTLEELRDYYFNLNGDDADDYFTQSPNNDAEM